jgi:branched-subunit amino acid ABC-type transport system permease component
VDFVANLMPHVVNGLSLGLLFALIALGFMLIVGVMEVINLAHGSLFALGAYFAIFIVGLNLGVGIEARYALAFFLAPLGVALVGMLLEVAMRRTYGRDPLYGLLLTFGAALVIEELIRLVWGSTEKQLPLPPDLSGAMLIGGFIYSKYRLYASGAAVVLILLLYFDPL